MAAEPAATGSTAAADIAAETDTAAGAATGASADDAEPETVGIVPKGSMTQEEYTYAERALLIILYLKEVLQMLDDFEVEGA